MKFKILVQDQDTLQWLTEEVEGEQVTIRDVECFIFEDQEETEQGKHASGVDRQKVTTHWRKSDLERGHHDCEVSRNNRLWSLEIKAVNKKKKYVDKQSDVQKEFERKLKDKYGNDYYIIRGMDDFFSLYDEIISKQLP